MQKKLQIWRCFRLEGLGSKVTYYRRLKGLSMQELARDICDISTVYRLENGKQLPRLEILNDICLKLELPIQALFPMNGEIERLKELCREFTYTFDYLSLEIILEQCEDLLEDIPSNFNRIMFYKFIEWHKAILLDKAQQRPELALKKLKPLVTTKNYGSELDFNIMNSIGLIYLSLNKYNHALNIFKELFPKVTSRPFLEDKTLLPRIGYNYALSLYNLKYYNDALRISNEVLLYLESNYLSYSLDQTYHLIGILYKKCGDLQEAEVAFRKSALLFEFNNDLANKEIVLKSIKNLSN